MSGMHRARPRGTDLLDKGLIQVVRPTNAEVDHIHASGHCIIEGIQKPGCVRYLHTRVLSSSTRPAGLNLPTYQHTANVHAEYIFEFEQHDLDKDRQLHT